MLKKILNGTPLGFAEFFTFDEHAINALDLVEEWLQFEPFWVHFECKARGTDVNRPATMSVIPC